MWAARRAVVGCSRVMVGGGIVTMLHKARLLAASTMCACGIDKSLTSAFGSAACYHECLYTESRRLILRLASACKRLKTNIGFITGDTRRLACDGTLTQTRLHFIGFVPFTCVDNYIHAESRGANSCV
jgi:hypothetical protein